jgi:hypothetical protein
MPRAQVGVECASPELLQQTDGALVVGRADQALQGDLVRLQPGPNAGTLAVHPCPEFQSYLALVEAERPTPSYRESVLAPGAAGRARGDSNPHARPRSICVAHDPHCTECPSRVTAPSAAWKDWPFRRGPSGTFDQGADAAPDRKSGRAESRDGSQARARLCRRSTVTHYRTQAS